MSAAFKNAVVIVAGGASGMGEQVAMQLAGIARAIIILDRNERAGAAVAGKLAESVVFETIDMNDAKAVTAALQRIRADYGALDYFFNFAGSFLGGEMRDTPAADWHKIFDANVHPIIHGSTVAYDIMRQDGHGHIVNVASAAGLFPVPAMSVYGGSKYAVVGLSLGLRLEAKTCNVAVSVVCPTIVQTPLYDTAMYDGLDKDKALDLLKNRLKVQQPDTAARRIIQGVAKNKAIIHTAFSTRLAWGLYRISPELYLMVSQRFLKIYRRTLRDK